MQINSNITQHQQSKQNNLKNEYTVTITPIILTIRK